MGSLENGNAKPTVWYKLGRSNFHFQSRDKATVHATLGVDYVPGPHCGLEHVLRSMVQSHPDGGVKVNVNFEGIANVSAGPGGDGSFDAKSVVVEVGDYRIKINTAGSGVHANWL